MDSTRLTIFIYYKKEDFIS